MMRRYLCDQTLKKIYHDYHGDGDNDNIDINNKISGEINNLDNLHCIDSINASESMNGCKLNNLDSTDIMLNYLWVDDELCIILCDAFMENIRKLNDVINNIKNNITINNNIYETVSLLNLNKFNCDKVFIEWWNNCVNNNFIPFLYNLINVNHPAYGDITVMKGFTLNNTNKLFTLSITPKISNATDDIIYNFYEKFLCLSQYNQCSNLKICMCKMYICKDRNYICDHDNVQMYLYMLASQKVIKNE